MFKLLLECKQMIEEVWGIEETLKWSVLEFYYLRPEQSSCGLSQDGGGSSDGGDADDDDGHMDFRN